MVSAPLEEMLLRSRAWGGSGGGAEHLLAFAPVARAELVRLKGVAFRATFVVDPDNVIQHVTVNGLNVGRNPQETLRVLDALQTDELCPCNWSEGQEVLRPAA